MPRISPGGPCAVCGKPSVARDLCQTHYKRWQRHDHVDSTRPADWGSKERHHLYASWCWTCRVKQGRDKKWNDFWTFVDDVRERPGKLYKLRRLDAKKPFGPENFFWLECTPNKSKAEAARKWRQNNRLRAKAIDLKKNHGITLEDYNFLLESQSWACAICRQIEHVFHKDGRRRALAIDHCHETGRIRGLLCTNCNKGLGHFHDDIKLLGIAKQYLESRLEKT